MVTCGFEQVDRVVLRERQSRDGRKLGQTLQVFRKKEIRSRKAPLVSGARLKPRSLKSWQLFKTNLPHQQGPMAARNWGHSLHSLCSYQGKLKPSIAYNLVAALLPKEGRGRILDPFAGVGTIPFEAQLMGHVGFGLRYQPGGDRDLSSENRGRRSVRGLEGPAEPGCSPGGRQRERSQAERA